MDTQTVNPVENSQSTSIFLRCLLKIYTVYCKFYDNSAFHRFFVKCGSAAYTSRVCSVIIAAWKKGVDYAESSFIMRIIYGVLRFFGRIIKSAGGLLRRINQQGLNVTVTRVYSSSARSIATGFKAASLVICAFLLGVGAIYNIKFAFSHSFYPIYQIAAPVIGILFLVAYLLDDKIIDNMITGCALYKLAVWLFR